MADEISDGLAADFIDLVDEARDLADDPDEVVTAAMEGVRAYIENAEPRANSRGRGVLLGDDPDGRGYEPAPSIMSRDGDGGSRGGFELPSLLEDDD